MARRAHVVLSLLLIGLMGPPPANALPGSMPRSLLECEGAGPCTGYWTFEGNSGKAEWPTEATTADLTVERFDSNHVVINRFDTSKAGFTAVYTGVIKGDSITGSVVWSWPSHWSQPAHGIWRAIVNPETFVRTPQSRYADLEELRRYVVSAPVPPLITGSHVSSTPTFFDLNGLWQSSTRQADGTLAVPIRVRQEGAHVQMTQNTHANMLYDSPRDSHDVVFFDGIYKTAQIIGRGRAGAVSGPPEWLDDAVTVASPDELLVNASIFRRLSPTHQGDVVCDLAQPAYIDLGSADLRASSSTKEHRFDRAACWSRIAADEGDARAATRLAFMYLAGTGVPKEAPKAFFWANIASVRGDEAASTLVAEMCERGIGTAVDHKRAKVMRTIAESQKIQAGIAPGMLANIILGGGIMLLLGSMSEDHCYETRRDSNTGFSYSETVPCGNPLGL